MTNKFKLVSRVVDTLRTEARFITERHWSQTEAYCKFRKHLPPDDPSVEWAAILNETHPLFPPEDFDYAAYGLSSDSSEEDFQNAYYRELNKVGPANLRQALKDFLK